MKKIIVGSFILLTTLAVKAQNIKLPVGKKLQVSTEMKNSMKMSIMGQDMEIPMTSSTLSDATVKEMNTNNAIITVTLKNVKGSLSVMGQEQTFSSDDADAKNNPTAAEALKNLNKPEDIIIENGKVKGTEKSVGSPSEMSNSGLVSLLFLTANDKDLKEGFNWATSVTNTDGTTNTNNTITKLTKDEIEVTALSTVKYSGTKEQAGMQVKINLSGTTSTISVYDVATNLLKASAQKSEMNGTMNIMGSDAPVSMTSTITVTVK